MTAAKAFAKGHPLVLFFALAFAFSWVAWAPAVVLSRGPSEPQTLAALLHLLGGLGPMLSAFVVSVYDGRAKPTAFEVFEEEEVEFVHPPILRDDRRLAHDVFGPLPNPRVAEGQASERLRRHRAGRVARGVGDAEPARIRSVGVAGW